MNQVEELVDRPKSGKWVKCQKEMRGAKAIIQWHELNRLLKTWASDFAPPDPARRHRPRSSRTVKARSRLIGKTEKQPDQAPAQPGYWPKTLVTAYFFVHDCLSACAKSVGAHHQSILKQIRPNCSNHKGGYKNLPPRSSEKSLTGL